MRWSLLRPPEGLRQSAGDVDLLVDPQSVPRARAVVTDRGFVPVPMGGRDVHAVDFDRECGRFLWLHLQPEIRIGGLHLPADAVLDLVVRDPLPRPSDPWLFWILILHGLLDKGSIAERHRPAVQRLAADAVAHGWVAPEPLRKLAVRRGIDPERAAELAAAGSWTELDSLAITRAVEKVPLRQRAQGKFVAIGSLWARRGIAVAVVGPDGAGKTTLVTGLRESLPFPVRILYGGLTGGRLPKADALRLPGLVFASRMALIWMRYAAGAYHRLRGRVVLFDRYPLDAVVPSGAPLRPVARLSRRLQGHLCPRPDLILVLDASGVTMHDRKGEYDPVRLEAWRSAYRRLNDSKRVQLLDAERPAATVLADAQERIWKLYRDRWSSAPSSRGSGVRR